MIRRRSRLNVEGLLFACHDVLIDVQYSYREVVRKTVQIYLEQALGLLPSSEPLLTAEEVLLLQKRGNIASYWDLTKAFVMYFVELLPPVPAPTFPSKFHVPALMAYLQFAGGNLRVSVESLRQKRDVAHFALLVASAGGGLEGAHQVLPKENRHMLVATGDITRTNIVGRIFQELYLGANLFKQVYDQPAIIVQSTGYAEHESLVIDPAVLGYISQKLPMGVVSDRPRSEVERSLRAQKIDRYFQVLVTLDEMKQAGAGMLPAPWLLLEAARLLHPIPAHTAYVGANLSDIQAAQMANKTVPFFGIGCLENAHDREEMRQAFEVQKAHIILGHPNNIKELIIGS
jgi:phosphoglycolate phosphatase-like HAD superfamily hydrolase